MTLKLATGAPEGLPCTMHRRFIEHPYTAERFSAAYRKFLKGEKSAIGATRPIQTEIHLQQSAAGGPEPVSKCRTMASARAGTV